MRKGRHNRSGDPKNGPSVIKKEVEATEVAKTEVKEESEKIEAVEIVDGVETPVEAVVVNDDTPEEAKEVESEEEVIKTESKIKIWFRNAWMQTYCTFITNKIVFTVLLIVIIVSLIGTLAYVKREVHSSEPKEKPIVGNVSIPGDSSQKSIRKSDDRKDIVITKQKIFTYIIYDDFTNEAVTIRSTFDDSDKIIDHIKSLYPKETMFQVLHKSETEYTKESTTIIREKK